MWKDDRKHYVKKCYHCNGPNIYEGNLGYYRCVHCEKMTICIVMTRENYEVHMQERKQRV
jgi:hypothetical protein